MTNIPQDPSPQDLKLEQFITAMQRAWLLCDDKVQARRLWGEYCLALKARSPEQVERMEIARGLR